MLSISSLREHRILGMAIFDWITSLIGGIIIGYFILERPNLLMWTIWLIIWVLFGIAVHLFFGIDTMLGYYLGLNKAPLRNENRLH